jgi:hypothetical protein
MFGQLFQSLVCKSATGGSYALVKIPPKKRRKEKCEDFTFIEKKDLKEDHAL